MSIKPDPWHFPREAFSTHCLEQFKIGLSHRLTLVAPRRKGKTEFLLYDLAPKAAKAGYNTVYASLWDDINQPQRGLLDALRLAVEAKKKRQSITTSVLTTAIERVKISALGLGAELQFAENPLAADSAELQEISRLFEQLNSGKRTKLLLVLDEIQHLATSKAFLPLMYSLRTTLDTQRDIHVMFSGSSRGGIRKTFNDHDAPFFGFSSEIELPDLDQTFTDFLAATYAKLTTRTINEKNLWRQFEKVDRNPFYVRESLKLMALDPALSLDHAMSRVLTAISNQNDYPTKWKKLSAIDRALFLAIANSSDSSGLHTQESLNALSKSTGKKVSATLVGRRLKRLSDQNLVSKTSRGIYQVELPGFKEWVIRNTASI